MNLKTNSKEIDLIKAFKKGDGRAFEELFNRHHKKLYAFLYGMLNSKEDAEEIVQEAFVKIWERREQFIEDNLFESFLFKIAKNAFLNLARKRVTKLVFDNQSDLLPEILSNDTDDYIIYKETKQIIDSIINELPPKRKEIFLLRRVDGLSRHEISHEMGISIITVDNQLMKAKKYLKSELEKYGV